MAKGEKWKALWDSLKQSNRFWGFTVAAVGTLLLPTPFAAASPYFITGGLSWAGVGLTGVMKKKEEAKKVASGEVTDKVESKVD